MNYRVLLYCLALGLGCQAATANAFLMTLSPSDSGEIVIDSIPSTPPPNVVITAAYSHTEGLQTLLTTLTGSPLHTGPGIGQHRNGYLIYDLSALVFTVQSATFTFDLNVQAPAAGALSIFSVDSILAGDLAALDPGVLPDQPVGSPPFYGEILSDDLAQGTLFGQTNLSPGNGLFNLSLNAAGVSAINNAGSLLAVGVNYFGDFSSRADFGAAPQLVLSSEAVAVPAPGTAWLLLSTILLLPGQRRKRVAAH